MQTNEMKPDPKSAPDSVQKRVGIFLALTVAVLLSQGSVAADEVVLDAPKILQESAQPLKLRKIRRAPKGAPTVAQINDVAREQGPAAAEKLAANSLKASELAYGPNHPRTVTPLINLAHLQQQSGETGKALLNYKRAVELAETTGGPRDPRLFDAWYGIGYAHLEAGQYQPAISALETALQINRISSGLYNKDQLPVLHALALAERAIGEAEDADRHQVDRLVAAERIHGLSTAGAAETYIDVGRWFRNTGDIERSISLQGLAVKILESQYPNDPRLIDPLIELATSASRRALEFDQAPLPPQLRPQVAIEKAQRLIDADSKASPEQNARNRIRIGDVQFNIGKRDQALANYAIAADLLESIGKRPPFDRPHLVDIVLPPTPPVEGKNGFLLAKFDISEKGKIRRTKIASYEPDSVPVSLRIRFRDAIKSAHVRPRIVNGEPVASQGVLFRLPLKGSDPT